MLRVLDSVVSRDRSRSRGPHLAFPISEQGRHTKVMISELDTWPMSSPVNASPAALRPPAHDSGPRWCAIPFLCGSLIRYSMPVYPGAFSDFFFAYAALLYLNVCAARANFPETENARIRIFLPPRRKDAKFGRNKIVLKRIHCLFSDPCALASLREIFRD